jgi:BirA family biotin operon repressor/biotin-[acetyl-CoA-carboxylase] ligase
MPGTSAGVKPKCLIMTFDAPALERSTWVDRVVHHERLSSTNDLARQLAADTPRGKSLLVLADEQTAGRGRGSNRWWTGEGSLAFSLLLDSPRLGIPRRQAAMISLAAAVALAETVAPLVPHARPGIHWPNDVFVSDRKLAGILVEALADGRHIVGVGMNINNRLALAPPDLQPTITSLVDLTGRTHDRSQLLLELLGSLQAALQQLARSPADLAQRADSLCLQHGQRLAIDVGGNIDAGICAGIADDGSLVLDTPAGPRNVYSGVLIKHAL